MQCKVVDISPQRWKWEENGWFECPPPPQKVFYLFLQLQVSLEFKSLLSQKGKQNRSGTLRRWWKALLWHVVVVALGTTRLYLSVSLCRKGKLQQEQIHHRVKREKSKMAGWALWWEEREEYRWKAPRMIWDIYNVIIYDVLVSEVTAEFLFPVRFLRRI